ncbi:hypothetical protein [Burkholderia territorii]|uniref:hypothetical protein n=1 Tax=Burkholderia territorii TaxID=1503055 RepID=UPI001E3EFCFF|nr:hypothetical protein [Burkholderia territorii]
MQSTIGYVSSDRTQTTEGSQADVNLSSGVELVFRTDYVSLNRLAGVGGIERIRVNTINPDPEATRLSSERTAQRSAGQRRAAQSSAEQRRAAQSSAEQRRAAQSCAEQSRAEQSRAEQSRPTWPLAELRGTTGRAREPAGLVGTFIFFSFVAESGASSHSLAGARAARSDSTSFPCCCNGAGTPRGDMNGRTVSVGETPYRTASRR